MALITVKIERKARRPGEAPRRRTTRRLGAAGVGVAALVGALVASTGVAHASVVSIPAKTIANNVAVAGHGVVQLVAIGASTTVPTDATRVVFSATVTGATANGNVTANPTGATGSGDLVHYTSGTTSTGTLTEQVGLSNQVAFHNGGANSINLTVKITGYSTEVRAGDISPTGGAAGQVLTNTGSGAAWQPSGHAYGVTDAFSTYALDTGFTTVASVTVPAGSYVATFTTTVAGSSDTTPDDIGCYLYSPAGNEVSVVYGNTDASNNQSVISAQGLVASNTGGTITAQCADSDATATAYYPTLIANAVGAVDGASSNIRPQLKPVRLGASAVHK